MNSNLQITIEQNLDNPKFFILGDSRTGTLAVSNFFNALGFKSIHYYVKESNQMPNDETNRETNSRNLLNYINNSNAQCFSDYPTRLFYKELAEAYPNAYYILTYRKDIDIWKVSMMRYFAKFKIPIDIDNLSIWYDLLNKEIRDFFYDNSNLKFLELCIDDDTKQNSEKIKIFIDVKSEAILSKDNQTAHVKPEIPSGRFTFLDFDAGDPIMQINHYRKDCMGLLSERGWIYLINDSNQYLDYLYNKKSWDENETLKANFVFNERNKIFNTPNRKYFKFIIPEKAVVYGEYLPKSLANIEMSGKRPAKILKQNFEPVVSYLDEYLNDAKSYGFLYFRGDTHPNWLGGYFIYQYIVKHVNYNAGDILRAPVALSHLQPVLAGYDGDLVNQIAPVEKLALDDQFADLQSKTFFESVIRYELPNEIRKSRDVTREDHLSRLEFSRGVIIKEVDDISLPSAVIFRDSTADFIVDLLAEHFRRAVFVWHQGQIVNDVLDVEKPDLIIHVMAERFVVAYGKSMSTSIEMNPRQDS